MFYNKEFGVREHSGVNFELSANNQIRLVSLYLASVARFIVS
jgi:hypothetical protein